jgi:uncharacterized protein YndB with AHSA1/START domain
MLLVVFLIGLFGSLLLFVIFIAMQPALYRVSRQITIAAPPEAVFDRVNDFRQWEAWSPWEKIDPTMRKTYSGEPAGHGAIYEWDSEGKAGKGRMTLGESLPVERIRIKLEMMRPIASRSEVEFALLRQEDQTTVTWTTAGRNGFLAKAFCLFVNMDKLLGADFEKGLSQLKAVTECSPQATASAATGVR